MMELSARKQDTNPIIRQESTGEKDTFGPLRSQQGVADFDKDPPPADNPMTTATKIEWFLSVNLQVSIRDLVRLTPDMYDSYGSFGSLDEELLKAYGVSPFAARKISWLATYVAMNDELPDDNFSL